MEKHNVRGLLGGLVSALVEAKPRDPVQFIIDRLTLADPTEAVQDDQGISKRAPILLF